jgi:PAS domain S-box-containing protein
MQNDRTIVQSLQNTLGRLEIALGAIREAIVWTDERDIIQWCNKSFDSLVSLPHIAVLGSCICEIFPLEKDNQKVSIDRYPSRLPQKKQSITNHLYQFNRKNKRIDVEISGNYADLRGKEVIVILTVRNVTRFLKSKRDLEKAKQTLELSVQKRTEELELVTNKYRSIVFEAVDAIVTIDQQGRILSFNPAAEQIFGYHEDEVAGRNVSLLMPAPYRDKHDQFIKDYLTTGIGKIIGVGGREVVGLRSNGQQFPVDLSVSEVQLADEVLFTGIVRDITARKEVEDALENARLEAETANRAKSDFLAHMSHEIRTPLNAILGMADLLAETDLTEGQEKYISISKRAGNHLLSLINDLLDLAKIEANQFRLDSVPFNLKELLFETCSFMRTAAQRKNLELDYTLDSGIPSTLLGDPKRVRQVLINLLGNAVKFTEKGSVSLHVRPVHSEGSHKSEPERVEIEFEVKDTGIGIQHDNMETIFDRFSQADQTITRKFGGTGLGLAVSRNLVVMMGGNIRVISREQAGSIFTFNAWFETRPGDEEYKNGQPQPTLSPQDLYSSAGPLKILLAEDSADNRFLFQAYLKDYDCTLECAVNGQIAVQKFLQGGFDLILMDVQMPILDGYRATQEIRSHERQKNLSAIPIIALTAHALSEDREKSIQYGCDMHLVKPISKHDFLAAIQSITSPRNTSLPIPFSVHIDKMLEDLIPGFLDNRRDDITAIRDAVSKDDLATVEMLGHMMKGSGGGYGFEGITEIGKKIEHAAKQKKPDRILELAEELESYLRRVQITFVD